MSARAWAAQLCPCAHKAACARDCGFAHWHVPICGAPPAPGEHACPSMCHVSCPSMTPVSPQGIVRVWASHQPVPPPHTRCLASIAFPLPGQRLQPAEARLSCPRCSPPWPACRLLLLPCSPGKQPAGWAGAAGHQEGQGQWARRACTGGRAAAGMWLCMLPVPLTTSQPRERASGLDIQGCEDLTTALTNLTALEHYPAPLVIHPLVLPPSSLQGFLYSLLEVFNVTRCSSTI